MSNSLRIEQRTFRTDRAPVVALAVVQNPPAGYGPIDTGREPNLPDEALLQIAG